MRHYISLIWITCLIVSGCGNSPSTAKDGEDPTTAENKSIDTLHSEDSATTIPTNDNAILYMDCSYSMKGYLSTATDATFKDVISSLLYWKPTKAYLFDTKERPEISRDDFVKIINKRNISWSDESDLHKMLSSMIGKVNGGDVGIAYLITDGIMSGSNQDVRDDSSFNITTRGTLMKKISDAVSQCRKDAAILLLKYTSNFTGRYYCYNNVDQVNLKETKRPFYVIAIGSRKLVKDLSGKAQTEELMCNNLGLLLLGDVYPYDISFRVNKKDVIIGKDKDGQFTLRKNIRSDSTVWFCANLSNLPSYMQSPEYFNKNGEFYIQYYKRGEFKRLDSQYISYNTDGTNLNVEIQAKYIMHNAIFFKLRYELPNWIEMSSCDDDKNIGQSPVPKTFNFKYFVKGLAKINTNEYITKVDTLKFK